MHACSRAEAAADVSGRGTAASRKGKAVDWFAPAAGLQAAAGRAAAEQQRNAEKHLREALRLQPGAVEIAFALIQVCCGSSARRKTSVLCREEACSSGLATLLCQWCLQHCHAAASFKRHHIPPPAVHDPYGLKPRFAVKLDRTPCVICLQIHFATGRPEQALSTATSVAESNPEDVNAHALNLLCMEALGKIDDSPAEALMACARMLQCNGTSHRCVGSAPSHMAVLSFVLCGSSRLR